MNRSRKTIKLSKQLKETLIIRIVCVLISRQWTEMLPIQCFLYITRSLKETTEVVRWVRSFMVVNIEKQCRMKMQLLKLVCLNCKRTTSHNKNRIPNRSTNNHIKIKENTLIQVVLSTVMKTSTNVGKHRSPMNNLYLRIDLVKTMMRMMSRVNHSHLIDTDE